MISLNLNSLVTMECYWCWQTVRICL